MNLEKYIVKSNSTIKDAMIKIETNLEGCVFILNNQNELVAISTDGDIRRGLILGASLENCIIDVANFDFVSLKNDTSKENLMKTLDNRYKIIPIVDSNNKLIDFATKNKIPQVLKNKSYYRSRSPVRISFSGGGSDISTFFVTNGGAVLNATISLYSHVTLKIRNDLKIMIHSQDLNDQIFFNSIDELDNYNGNFSLIKSVIQIIKPNFGFDLFIYSDFPMSSGLGGSAVVTSAILGCFNEHRNDKWDKYEIAEFAYQSERLHLGVSGGWQDQYATVFGGMNFMEFNSNENIVIPLRFNNELLNELEESLILCYTGLTHDSGIIHKDQNLQTKNDNVKSKINQIVELTNEMKNFLLKGKLLEFGKALHNTWELKRSFSEKISNSVIDNLYNEAQNNGAVGGKLLGAGGGGFFLFYVQPENKLKLIQWLNSKNLKFTRFNFEDKGLQSWTVREN